MKNSANWPSARKIRAIIGMLRITNQATGKKVPWPISSEQEVLIEDTINHRQLIVLKGRQIGASTFFCAMDVIAAIYNPGWQIGIVADSEDKAFGLLGRCRDFALQLGLKPEIVKDNRSEIQFNNGSGIKAITATSSKTKDNEESRAGRSFSFQMLHLSELAFWPDQATFGALTASAGLAAPVIIESTASGPGDLFYDIWHGRNGFKKRFFSLEDHQNYRSDDYELTVNEMEQAEEIGFTIESASRWFFEQVNGRFRGDITKALREYPQTPQQAFLSTAGRWINHTPEVRPSKMVQGMNVYADPVEGRSYVLGVDVSRGVGSDSSTICVIDDQSHEIMADYKNNEVKLDDFELQIISAANLYSAKCVIEVNGVGAGVPAHVNKLDPFINIKEVYTNPGSQYEALLLAKRAVEQHGACSGDALKEECESLVVDSKDRFTGKKDLLMALGFALTEASKYPKIKKPERENVGDNVFSLKRYMANKRRSSKNRLV